MKILKLPLARTHFASGAFAPRQYWVVLGLSWNRTEAYNFAQKPKFNNFISVDPFDFGSPFTEAIEPL